MSSATIAVALLLFPAAGAAQHYQTDFPAEELKASHAKLFERIGARASTFFRVSFAI